MSGSPPVVAFFCATYLKPEMHHVHRQILAVAPAWRAVVLAQKVENRERFPTDDLRVVPRSAWRFAARMRERHLGGAPWQITRGEAERLAAACRAADVRVLHVFFGNVAVHLLPLLERVDLPVVVSFHGADVAGAIASPRYERARERVFARADRVVARSEALAGAVHRLGCPGGKLGVIRTALPEVSFVPRELPGDGRIHLVQAGRLVPKKGFATSLEAVARLVQRFPGLTFTIAGAGPLEADLRARAAELGLADCVRFAGFLDQDGLRSLFASAHAFLHPSETVGGDVEGIPNALLEAMATGLPVVSTRHGGIGEAVEDGVTGLLAPERDPVALAKAVERLLGDPAFHARVARAGATAVAARFSREVVARDLDALYRGVAGMPAVTG